MTIVSQKMLLWLLAIAGVLIALWPESDSIDHEVESSKEEPWKKLPTKFSREDNNESPAWTNIKEFEEWVIQTRPDLWEPDETSSEDDEKTS